MPKGLKIRPISLLLVTYKLITRVILSRISATSVRFALVGGGRIPHSFGTVNSHRFNLGYHSVYSYPSLGIKLYLYFGLL